MRARHWIAGTLVALALAGGANAQRVSQVVNSIVATTCTNQFVRSVAATGAATCATVNFASDGTGIVPAANGGAGTVNGALAGNGSGAVSQAACASLSNGATGCSTAVTNPTASTSANLSAGCGTSPALSSVKELVVGTVRVSSGVISTGNPGPTSCVLTFATAFGANQICTVSARTASANYTSYSVVAASLTVVTTSALASYDYVCVGAP